MTYKTFKHKPRKRFGQNFLIDDQIIARIIKTIAPKPKDNLLEIGAGQGALTLPLLAKTDQLNVIEIDTNLITLLRVIQTQHPHLIIHSGDALKFDLSQLNTPLRIVGNLPYNISSPLLFHFLAQRTHIIDMTFMLQKEVVARITADCGNKIYGRLSVMIQAFFAVEMVFEVPATAFFPQPKVDSAIIYLKPHPVAKVDNFNTFALIVKACFAQRRKTLRNCLKSHLTQTQTRIDLTQRAEALSIADFITLTHDYEHRQP